MIARVRRYLGDERGAMAAEFTLVLPVLALFVFGFIHMCLMMYTVTRLHFAAEDAARCASIRSACKVDGVATQALVQTWATNHYAGMAPATFSYSATGACSQSEGAANGHAVTATATYSLAVPLYAHDFDLAANACFP